MKTLAFLSSVLSVLLRCTQHTLCGEVFTFGWKACWLISDDNLLAYNQIDITVAERIFEC